MYYLSINPQSSNFRQKVGTEKFITTRLVCKFTTQNIKLNSNRVCEFKIRLYFLQKINKILILKYYGTPVFNLFELNMNKQKYLLRGDWHGGISIWNLNEISSSNLFFLILFIFHANNIIN